nr:HEAT repeat domain-containing protein [Solirubrobacterales bacterium]
AGLISRAERWCTSRRWWRRLRGVRLLGLLGRGDDVVPRLLHDANPDVRAEAAAWAAGSRSPAVVERLLELLEDPETLCRFAVKDSLLRLGEPVVDPLARRLPILEGVALREALTIAAALAEPRLRDPALALLGHRDPAVRALASDVVGRIGGVAAAERVAELLSDPDPAPRAAAARALGHLGHWRTAAQLTPLLRDPAWDVRRAAGVALRGLGAPGTLLLRRALADADPFAADMARQLLELPPAVTSEELG